MEHKITRFKAVTHKVTEDDARYLAGLAERLAQDSSRDNRVASVTVEFPVKDEPTYQPRIVDLDRQNKWLSNYDNLERFGGRYRFVLARLHDITREIVISLLTDAGDIQTRRTNEELFTAAGARYPFYADDLQELSTLRAFTDPHMLEPFYPNGSELLPKVARLRDKVAMLLGLAYQIRLETRKTGDK